VVVYNLEAKGKTNLKLTLPIQQLGLGAFNLFELSKNLRSMLLHNIMLSPTKPALVWRGNSNPSHIMDKEEMKKKKQDERRALRRSLIKFLRDRVPKSNKSNHSMFVNLIQRRVKDRLAL
jgi:hypothetical protein